MSFSIIASAKCPGESLEGFKQTFQGFMAPRGQLSVGAEAWAR